MMEELHKIIKIVDDTTPTTAEWIDIEDIKPDFKEHGTFIFAYKSGAVQVGTELHFAMSAEWITHWMPLPKHPKK